MSVRIGSKIETSVDVNMKKYLTILLLCATIHGVSQTKTKEVSLFNGKDLTGWKILNGKAKYDVVKGEIVGTTVPNEPNSFLVTDQVFGDFIFSLEFKIDSGTNSGIQFRSESKPEYQNGRVHGYQMEFDTSPRAWTGGIYDEGRRQWLYPLEYNPVAKKAFRMKEWNTARIECIGNTLRTFINDIPVAHLVDDMTPKGFIALQVHSVSKPEDAGKQVRWRNIKIQTQNLKPSPADNIHVVNLIPNTLSDQEKKNGVTLLWDGKTNEGWRAAYSDKFPEQGWEIKDGSLTVLKPSAPNSKHNDIVTEKEFGAFDLQFEFKLTEGANSGVKYFVQENEKYKGAAIGLEYQVLDDAKHPDAKQGVVGNRRQASLYDLIPAIQNTRGQHKVGEWNWARIVVYPDNRVEHWLNGYKVVEYQRGTPIYDALIARSKYAEYEKFGMGEKGRILLQDHGDEVSFRSIKIKDLTATK
ncbi:DUF1080 domain-containing protein [Chryseolinea sp. H1M3-3]|uniref:3-keto-disaccharide hydrolase n=1 Tax=Chryseolinea sp. H1M3-3 TaxID=3034144 RepID=UPI0023EBB9AA|nr:DUF1080 domain-containing protein [Chryseolinea sp. H1M3-3]